LGAGRILSVVMLSALEREKRLRSTRLDNPMLTNCLNQDSQD